GRLLELVSVRVRHPWRADAAGVVALAGALDLDHVRAKIAQRLGCERAGHDPRHVDDAKAVQWCSHVVVTSFVFHRFQSLNAVSFDSFPYALGRGDDLSACLDRSS